MALKLRVISDHYKALGKQSSRLFGFSGGRIGRAQDNDWILSDPDRYVSSHHCKVEYRAGKWLLEDTSTNGVFINGADMPASVDGTYALQDGDRLRLGDYEILVSLDERNDFPPDASGQMRAPPRVHKAAAKMPVKIADDLGEELDLTDLLSEPLITAAPDFAPKRGAAAFEPPDKFNATQPVKTLAPAPAPPAKPAAKPAPAPKPARNGLMSLLENAASDSDSRAGAPARKSDDWQMQTRPYDRKTLTALTSPAALARPEKADAERPRRGGESAPSDTSPALEAFCRGAGIDPSSLPGDAQTALLTLAGQMLRESVLGLMDVLKGRADLKNRLRLNQTQPGDNNPLKFSNSVDDAMLKLLDPHASRYLRPIEALRDAFGDLRMHQTALAAAIQSAIDEVMNRIEPGDLQERFDRGLKRGALLGAANNMKYWDMYAEFYQVLNQRNEQGLPTLFAEELARTYAERVQKKK